MNRSTWLATTNNNSSHQLPMISLNTLPTPNGILEMENETMIATMATTANVINMLGT